MGMRLKVLVEGQSEEAFVNRVLGPHLHHFEVWPVAFIVYTSRKRGARGGVTGFERIRRDLRRLMREDRNADVRFTSMFDLYRFPSDLPGMDSIAERDPYRRVDQVQAAFEKTIVEELDDNRFLPYLQLHEFEALIMAEPARLSHVYPARRKEIEGLEASLRHFESPEHVNLDDPPSKRIERAVPEYGKVAAAAQVTGAIGLDAIRAKCRHFHDWLTRIEALG